MGTPTNNLPLTQDEGVALFEEWVLPLFIFPARGYFPTNQVVAKLSVIYKVALRLNSWGLTLPIMAMPPTLGGNRLPEPPTFLLWQHATPFVLSKVEPQGVLALSRRHFETWAHHHGVALDGRYVSWLQLGPIPWKTTPFWGTLCKAYCLLRKKAPVANPRVKLIPGMPLWRSIWFRDTHNNTYYSPAMIRKGIHTASQMDSQAGGGGGRPPPHVGTTVPGRAGRAPRTAKGATLHPPERPPHHSGRHGTSGPCSATS